MELSVNKNSSNVLLWSKTNGELKIVMLVLHNSIVQIHLYVTIVLVNGLVMISLPSLKMSLLN
jgi:hypothetical protein